jgi:hypothetical protein
MGCTNSQVNRNRQMSPVVNNNNNNNNQKDDSGEDKDGGDNDGGDNDGEDNDGECDSDFVFFYEMESDSRSPSRTVTILLYDVWFTCHSFITAH